MDKALQTMIDNMPEKTGKSLEQWKEILRQKAFEKHGQAVSYLKTEHGVTHGFANTIVTLAKDEKASGEDLVQAQYQGKEALLPIYNALLGYCKSLGKDVIVTPKKGSVSLIRKRQFVLIKPATKTRVDLGLKLKDTPVAGRLEGSGPFGTMCTHRVQLTDADQVDTPVKEWIQKAYEQSV